MSHYRRAVQPGGTFFFTVVTFQRRAMLTSASARQILRQAVRETRIRHPFEIVAWVLLPEHLHAVWELPAGDGDFSMRWQKIKTRFTRGLLADGRPRSPVGASRRRSGERDVWQRRFWEHKVRDEADLTKHVEYVHWNPVKHGLVDRVVDWPWSTFHRYVRRGIYPADWGSSEAPSAAELDFEGE